MLFSVKISVYSLKYEPPHMFMTLNFWSSRYRQYRVKYLEYFKVDISRISFSFSRLTLTGQISVTLISW